MSPGLLLLLLLVLGCGFLLLAFSIVMHYVTRWREGWSASPQTQIEVAQMQSQLEQIRVELNQLKERQAEMTILMDDLKRSRLDC